MTGMSRRHALKTLAAAPLAARWTTTEVRAAHRAAAEARRAATAQGAAYVPRFFTPHEYATVTALANAILPADERSGSASDASVPEFIDFMMVDQPVRQVPMRGGLAWIDVECRRRFDRTFVAATEAQRAELLDDIAWPDRAPPALSHGVEFFTHVRDLTATGFWTSRIGIDDLQYEGNDYVIDWTGCPEEALRKLGLQP